MKIINFPNGASPVMGEFLFFHDKALVVLIFISILVFGLIILIYTKEYRRITFVDQQILEFFWTLLPGFILFFLALPSLKLLYYLDISDHMNPKNTIKSVGHQWYWTNRFFFNNSEYRNDMYMVQTEDLSLGDFRRLETDRVILIPVNQIIRLLLTSEDVIHRFALPRLGLKMDAVPGRIKQQYFRSNILGVFYGQCSEICGANHRFMPITVEVYYVK